MREQLKTVHQSIDENWKQLTLFDRGKIDLWFGLRNTLGAALGMAIGTFIWGASGGVVCALGALVVSYSDGHDPYPRRAPRLVLSTLFSSVAVFLGATAVANHWLAALIAGVWAFLAGMLLAVASSLSDLVLFSLTTYVIFASDSLPLPMAFKFAAICGVGGFLQTAISLAMWPFKPLSPERREVAALYLELAQSLIEKVSSKDVPMASESVNRAHFHLAGSLRFRSLLNQAERLRLSAHSLRRLRRRIELDRSTREFVQEIDTFLHSLSVILQKIGQITLQKSDLVAGEIRLLLQFIEQQRNEFSKKTKIAENESLDMKPFSQAALRDIAWQMGALGGQARSAFELSQQQSRQGLASTLDRERKKPWQLRFSGAFATMRANLNFRSVVFRHALRLAVAMLVGEGIAATLNMGRSYWIPMTIALVLRPDFSGTLQRGLLRVLGTIAGLLFATLLFKFIPYGFDFEIAFALFSIFVTRFLGGSNYGFVAFGVSGIAVALLALEGVDPAFAIKARLIHTSIGGAVALLLYCVWPSWEKDQSLTVLAQALRTYHNYFALVCSMSLGGDAQIADIEAARLEARMARSNLLASNQRLAGEPKVPAEQKKFMSGCFAASNRLAHASMAFESGLAVAESEKEGLRSLGASVQKTLLELVRALEHKKVERIDWFPDLRGQFALAFDLPEPDAHGVSAAVREMDRIVNALNTLRELILRHLSRSPEWEKIPGNKDL